MARVIATAKVNVRADTVGFTGPLNSAFGGLRKNIAAMGAALAAVGIGKLASEAVSFGAEYRTQLDNARAAVLGLTDSVGEADALMKEMTNFAINTPFSLPGVQDATAQLLAVGEQFGVTNENVLDYVQIYGDAIAITGGSEDTLRRVVRNFGQMAASGKVLGRDMNDLANNIPGLDVWGALADGTGTSVKELRRLQDLGQLDELLTGAEAVDILTEAIRDMPGAAGAMERKMNTLGGTIEFFKDSIGVALAEGMVPFFDTIQSILKDETLAAWLDVLIDSFARLASEILEGIAPVLPDLVKAFSNILQALIPLAPIIGVIAQVFADLTVAVAPVLASIALAIADLLPSVLDLFDAFMPLVELLGDLAVGAVEVFLIVLEPLIPILTEIAGILADSLAAILPDIIDAFVLLAEALVPIVEELGEQFVEILLELAPLLPELSEAFLALVEALIPLLPLVVDLSYMFVAILLPLLPELVLFVTDLINSFQDWVEAFGEVTAVVGPFVTELIDEFQKMYDETVGKVIDWVRDVIKWCENLYDTLVGNSIIPDLVNEIIRWFNILLGAVISVFQAMFNFIVSIWNTVYSVVSGVVSSTVSTVSTGFGALRSTVSSIMNGIRSVVSSIWNGIYSLVSLQVNAIRSTVGAVFSAMRTTVSIVWNGVKNAIIGPLQAAYNFVADKVRAISNLVQGAIDKVSSIPGAGLVGKGLGLLGFARGGVQDFGTGTPAVLHGREAIIPLSDPYRAMQVMQQAGLDRIVAKMNDRRSYDGPIVTMPGAVIQDATDADLVAQRTLVAMQAAMVA